MYNYTWDQGQDGNISIVYSEGTVGSMVSPSLTGYKLRMDICDGDGVKLATINSDDADALTADEVILGTAGQITVTVPRGFTLPGGELYAALVAGNNVFYYDVFLRNGASPPRQQKILRGQITVDKSYTIWP